MYDVFNTISLIPSRSLYLYILEIILSQIRSIKIYTYNGSSFFFFLFPPSTVTTAIQEVRIRGQYHHRRSTDQRIGYRRSLLSLSTSPARCTPPSLPHRGASRTHSSRFRLTGSDALCERLTTVFRRDTNTTQT